MAERFQQLAPETLDHPSRKPTEKQPSKGTCILFADGLRTT